MNFFEELSSFDSEVAAACDKELARQRHKDQHAGAGQRQYQAIEIVGHCLFTRFFVVGVS